jgi:hypothetical protein
MGTAVKTSPITAAPPFTVAPNNEREGQTILLFTLLVCRTSARRVKRLSDVAPSAIAMRRVVAPIFDKCWKSPSIGISSFEAASCYTVHREFCHQAFGT